MQKGNDCISVINEAINNLDFDQRSTDPFFLRNVKRIIKNCLHKLGVNKYEYYLTWRTGLLAKALLHEQEERNLDVTKIIESYINEFIINKGVIKSLDNIQNGEVVIDLYLTTNEKRYLDLLLSYVCYIKSYRQDKEGSLPFLNGYDIYVDGLMICPFIFKYCEKVNMDEELYSIGLKQISNYIRRGIDDNLQFPYHGYNVDNNLQLGIAGWGRGNGWFLYSIVDSLQYISSKEIIKNELVHYFRKIIDSTIKYQREDGLFSWFLLSPRGPIDTSASAMILYSIAKGINLGILADEYKGIVVNGFKSFQKFIVDGKVEQAMGDCKGFSMYPQVYSSYPWSLAFYLLLESEYHVLLK